MLSNRASGYTDAHNFGRRGVPDRAGRGPTLLHGYRLALARVFTTERATRSATMATSCPTRIVRLRSIAGRHLVLGASIGIAVASPGRSNPEDLLKSADLAMYRAKADGRGTYRFFEPEMDACAQARRAMEFALRSAHVESDFELHYQPLIDLASRQVTCMEALLRWRDPERGFISPADFIPQA